VSTVDAGQGVKEFLEGRVEAGEIPGAAWVIAGPGGVLDEGAVGHAVVVPDRIEATPSTVYDLASLTKPLVTSFLCLKLGRVLGLPPEQPVWRLLPEIDRLDKRDITLRHLLTHTSGLPDWIPFYLKGSTPSEYLGQLRDRPPGARPGATVIYSCAGYIMLGEILRRCSGSPLDRLAREVIFDPLRLSATTFNPSGELLRRVAATEESCKYERKLAGADADRYTGWRTGVIRGEVHDQNAWVLGGVAGNAGLFSTARETGTIAMEYLGEQATAAKGLLGDGAIRLAREDQTPGLNEARTFAFRVASRGETAAGPALPPEAFGHNGFTGTSVWIDPERLRVYVLLTNRVHPVASDSVGMITLRRRFHSLACRV
jgi:CubicO group peptidase (beta-lactamase class C family)